MLIGECLSKDFFSSALPYLFFKDFLESLSVDRACISKSVMALGSPMKDSCSWQRLSKPSYFGIVSVMNRS